MRTSNKTVANSCVPRGKALTAWHVSRALLLRGQWSNSNRQKSLRYCKQFLSHQLINAICPSTKHSSMQVMVIFARSVYSPQSSQTWQCYNTVVDILNMSISSWDMKSRVLKKSHSIKKNEDKYVARNNDQRVKTEH
jgi:hypothetical protein